MSSKENTDELKKILGDLSLKDIQPTDQIEKQVLLFSVGIISLSITGVIALREYETVKVLSEYSSLFSHGLYFVIISASFALLRMGVSSNVRNRLDNWEIQGRKEWYKGMFTGPIKVFIPFFLGICNISMFFCINIFDYNWPHLVELVIYALSLLLLPAYCLLFILTFKK